MYAQYKEGNFRELVGNVVFSPNVFQSAESLTDIQREEFDVFNIVDHREELPANHVYADSWTYEVIGTDIHRHWSIIPMTPEQIEAAYQATIPVAVTMRQARLALLGAGVLATADAAIAGMQGVEGDAARIEWEYAHEVRRDAPLVAGMASALGLTKSQLDGLFLTAVSL